MGLNKSLLFSTAFLSLLSFSQNAISERYSVEEDAFGNLTAKEMSKNDQEEVLIDRKQAFPAKKIESDSLVSDSEATSDTSLRSPVQSNEGSAAEEKQSDELSPFEKAYLESERIEKERVLKGLSEAPVIERYDQTKVDPVNFVDGDELEKGLIKDQAPYYTVIDENGNPRNIFYDVENIEEALDQKHKNKIELTKSKVYTSSDVEKSVPQNADKKALSLLFGESTESFYDKFARYCCSVLPNLNLSQLELGRSHYYEIDRELLPYRFAEGDSRFLLLSLPDHEVQKEFPIALRTYIKEHRKDAIDHGVFYPQIATLDANKQPMRVFTDPLLKYHEETWLKHGYLEGFFMISDTFENDEKYLLVYTTKDALKLSSTIDRVDDDPITIQHMAIGSVEIEVLAERSD